MTTNLSPNGDKLPWYKMSTNLLTKDLGNFIFTHSDLENKLHPGKQVGFIERSVPIEIEHYGNRYDSLCKILSEVKPLGAGSFGKVYKTKHKSPPVAIKDFIDKNFEEYTDIDIATRFNHSCLVKNFLVLSDLTCPTRKIITVMEFASTSMEKLIKEIHRGQKSLSQEKRLKIVLDVLQGLNYLHRNNILHLDIKPDNILVYTRPGYERGVLADFGLCQLLSFGTTTFSYSSRIGTPSYMFPLIFWSKKGDHLYDYRADMWSLGISAMEFFRGTNEISNKIHAKIKGLKKSQLKQMGDYASQLAQKEFAITEKKIPEPNRVLTGSLLGPVIIGYKDVAQHKTAAELLEEFGQAEKDGSVLVESSEDLAPEVLGGCHKSLSQLIRENPPLNVFFATIHLIYVTYKYPMFDRFSIRKRTKWCLEIISRILIFDRIDHTSEFRDFSTTLLTVLNGVLCTYNLSSYIYTPEELQRLGPLVFVPEKYFSTLRAIVEEKGYPSTVDSRMDKIGDMDVKDVVKRDPNGAFSRLVNRSTV